MITRPCYCTSEEVQDALDVRSTAYRRTQIERALESSSASAESLLRRDKFYPELTTHEFDWPNNSYADPWRLWLDEHELLSVVSLTSGGNLLTEGTHFVLSPEDGPPYDSIEILLSSSASFEASATFQRSLVIVGWFGYTNNTSEAATITANMNLTTTTVEVDTGAEVGVGDLLTISSEKMLVTGKGSSDTGVTLGADLDASNADDGVAVTDGSAFSVDEVLTIGTERMRIEDIIGNTLNVLRAADGSTLAAHSSGDAIYARRSLTVTRASVGSSAATHSSGDVVLRQEYPKMLRTLTLAEAINQLESETSAYARTIGSGEHTRNASGAGLEKLRAMARQDLGRQCRLGAI